MERSHGGGTRSMKKEEIKEIKDVEKDIKPGQWEEGWTESRTEKNIYKRADMRNVGMVKM